MQTVHKSLGALALVILSAAHAGCSGSSLTTSSTDGSPAMKMVAVMPEDAPPGITNDSPMARPASVAWTAARAQRCGFFFDPGKMKANYLAFESKQGTAGADLAKIEGVYDNTFKLILSKTSADANYCTDTRGQEIKANLARNLAGDFTPALPKPKMVADCGMFGCANPQQKIESKKLFSEMDKRI